MKRMLMLITLVTVLMPPMPCIGERAPDNIVLVSEEWRNATNADGTGLFWDLLRAVYEPEGIRVETMIRPYTEAVEMVKRQNADALVGVYTDELSGVNLPETHISVDVVAVLFKRDQRPSYQGPESLHWKRVGWIDGYAYDKYLSVDVLKRVFRDRKTAFDSLASGLIDYYVDAVSELVDAAAEGLYDPAAYGRETILILNVYPAFADTKKGERLMEVFDERMPSLVADGTVKSIYEKYANDDFIYPF